MTGHTQYTHDTLLELKDAGLVAATAVATVASVARILDLGAAEVLGEMIVDITAIEIATGDEGYTIILEGSDSSDFSTGTPLITQLAILQVGDGATLLGAAATDSTVGRYRVPFRNEVNGHVFRYARVNTVVVGTIATGINFTARLAKCG